MIFFWSILFVPSVWAETTCGEHVSMLQTKDQRHAAQKQQSLLDVVFENLRSTRSFESKEVSASVETLSLKLKTMCESWMRSPESRKEALFRRASASPAVHEIAEEFNKFPEATKIRLADTLRRSDAFRTLVETLSREQRIAFVQGFAQVTTVDAAVQAKTETRIERQEDGTDAKVTRTVNGDYMHEYKKTHNGTETTTKDKNGNTNHHHHSLERSPDGKDVKTKTKTEMHNSVNSYVHTHEHSHIDGVTSTETQNLASNRGDPLTGNHVITSGHKHTHNGKTGAHTTDSNLDVNGQSVLRHSFHDTDGDGIVDNHTAHYDPKHSGWLDASHSGCTGPLCDDVVEKGRNGVNLRANCHGHSGTRPATTAGWENEEGRNCVYYYNHHWCNGTACVNEDECNKEDQDTNENAGVACCECGGGVQFNESQTNGLPR